MIRFVERAVGLATVAFFAVDCAIIVMLVSIPAVGLVLSEHNEQHVAQNIAVRALQVEGCILTKVSRAKRFELDKISATEYAVYSNALTITCEKWEAKEETLFSLKISWEAPTAREDGTALTVGEIEYYAVIFDGVVKTIPSTETTHDIEAVEAGAHSIQLKTVDSGGIESAPSETVLFYVSSDDLE